MSRIKLRWLWIVLGVEVLVIVGLVVWALGFRQTAPELSPVIQVPQTEPTPKTQYKTPKIALTEVASGLKEPVGIFGIPKTDDKRLFVIEQAGAIRTIEGKKLDSTPFLDIKSKVLSGGEMGLLGLAFHPKVAENNYFYVNYIDKSQNTVVARYSLKSGGDVADPGSEKVLLKIKQPYANHNGGNMAFGPDGFLYIGMGDGGRAGDPDNRAQDKNDLLGKMLRLNVDGGALYSSPESNPFVGGGGKPEIWALGLRNPWRFSFDSKTGDLYIADVGQGEYEEISFQAANSRGGENYGWRCYEGSHPYKTDGCAAASSFVAPIIQYDHSQDRCSVTGGYVYRGSQFPALAGKYFYGDFCGGQLYYAEQASGAWSPVTALDTEYRVSTFGQDNSGELYLADYDSGAIYQLTDTAN
jgi:glucose/arabinose dehydrogenase